MLLGIGLSPAVYDHFGWTAMALLWGGLSLVLYVISLFGMRENVDFAHEEQPPFWQAVRVTFANRAYLLFLGVGFMTRLGQSMLTTVIPFYVKYVLRIPDARSSWFLGATFGLAVILMWPWQRIIKRIGTRWSYVAGMAALGICCLPLLFANSFEATLVTCLFISFGYAGLTILPEVMLSEIVDEDHINIGARREGMYWGLYGFAQRFPIGVANLVFGYMLAWTGYVHPTAAVARPVQPLATVLGIRHYASTGVLLTMLIGVGFALAYPLYGRRLRRVQERMAALRARLRERGAALVQEPVRLQTGPLGNGNR